MWGWGTFAKCRTWLSYCLILHPLFSALHYGSVAQHGALHIVKHKTNVIISLTYIDQKVIGARGKLYLQSARTKTRMLNQQWVLIVHSRKVLFASFYSCVPLTQFIFLRKRWMMPRHKLLCPDMRTLGMY
jgi:hypothetical protein